MREEDNFQFLELFGGIREEYIEQALKPWKEERKLISFYHWGRKAACILLVLTVALCLFFPNQSRAAIRHVTRALADFLHIEADISPYSTIMGTKMEKEGYSVTLDEVIYSDQNIYALISVEGEEEAGIGISDSFLSVDGQKISCSTTAIYGDENLDNSDQQYVLQGICEELESFHDEASIELQFYLSVSNDTKKIPFSFSFTASRETLEKNTVSVSPDMSFVVSGTDFWIETLTINSIYSQIVLNSTWNFMDDRLYFILATDSTGKQVRYGLTNLSGNTVTFQNEEGLPSTDAEWIDLKLYTLEAESTKMDSDSSDSSIAESDMYTIDDLYTIEEELMEPLSDTIRVIIKK